MRYTVIIPIILMLACAKEQDTITIPSGYRVCVSVAMTGDEFCYELTTTCTDANRNGNCIGWDSVAINIGFGDTVLLVTDASNIKSYFNGHLYKIVDNDGEVIIRIPE